MISLRSKGLSGVFSNTTVQKHQFFGREGTQPCPSTENWIKDLLSMTPPISTRPSFPPSQSLPTGSFHKPLILIHQRAESRYSENYNHRKLVTWTIALSNSCCVGPPKTDGSLWRVLIKHAPPGEGDSKPLQYPCLENPMNIRESQKDTKHKIDHFNYLLSSQFSGIKHIDYHYLFLELFHPPKRKLFIH